MSNNASGTELGIRDSMQNMVLCSIIHSIIQQTLLSARNGKCMRQIKYDPYFSKVYILIM